MEYATNESMLRLLLDNGADINTRSRGGGTWLHSAALVDYHKAEMLLRHGADPNARDDDDETPLFAAQQARRADIAELLLKNGADVNAQGNNGWTPLHGAVVGGSYNVAQVLLRHGADTELRDKKGDTPLIVAALMYDVWEHDFVGLLLQHGAVVNGASGRDGFRPIHCAAYHGYDSLVRRLFEAAADVNAEAAHSLTAVDVATSRGHTSTAQLLRDLGGREGRGGSRGSGERLPHTD
jgi:ankyrin repeat protein